MMTSNQNAVQRRVTRRIVLAVVLAFVLIGLFGMFSVRGAAFDHLHAAHRLILADTTSRIATKLEQVSDNLASLASEAVVRQFALEGRNVPSALGVREIALSRLVDWMRIRPDEFIAVRLINQQGQVQTEVANTTRGTQLVDTAGVTVPEPLYSEALNARIGQVFLTSPHTYEVVTGQMTPGFLFSTPVYPVGGGSTPLGVLQLEVNSRSILEVVLEAEVSELTGVAGRRLLVVNNANQYLADSEAEDISQLFVNVTGAGRELAPAGRSGRSAVEIDQFLLENSGSLEVATLGNHLISARAEHFFPAVDMPWRVVLVDDANRAFGSSNTQSLLIFAVSLIVGGGVAAGVAALARRELRPLERASALAQQLVQPAGGPLAPVDGAEDSLTQAIMQMAERMNTLVKETEEQRRRVEGNLQIAARISREAGLQDDLDALLNLVINLICAEYQFHHAQIFMLDEVGERAVLAYSHGEAGQALLQYGIRLPVRGTSAVSRVITGRQPVLETTPAAEHEHDALLPGTQSRLLLPLFAADRVIGVLDIQSTEAHIFRPDEMQAFELLADQIGIAVYNIQLLQQSQERVEQINTLNRELTRASWEGVEEKFQIEPAYHYDLREVKPGSKPVDDALSVPITIRGHVIGSLDIATPDGGSLTPDEQLVLQAVTDRVALAIDRARLFQETQLSLSETSLLYDLSRHINEATRLDEIIRAIIVSVMPDAVGGQVMEFDPYAPGGQPEHLTVTADWYRPDHDRAQDTLVGLRLNLKQHGLADVLLPDQVLLIGDLAAAANLDDHIRDLLHSVGARALAVVPLTMRGLWRGAIAIEFPEPRRFTAQDQRIYTALIDQAGVAIDNSLLLRQTAAALEETSRLYAASRAISSAPSLSLVFAAAAEHLAEAASVTNQIMILLAVPERVPDAPYLEYGYVWHWGTDHHDLIGEQVERAAVPYTRMVEDQSGVVLLADVARDLASHPDLRRRLLEQDNVASVVVTPLRLRQKWFGILVCASDQPGGFDDQYAQFVQTVGDQLAIAVENYDLIRAAEGERETLSSILDSMPSGVLVLDAETYLPLHTNEQIEELLGRPISMTEPFSAAYYNLYRTGTELLYTDEDMPIYLAAKMGDLAFADDLVAIHADGTQVDLLLNAAPIREPDGSIRMIVATFENITSLRSLENALQDNLRETVALYEATRALAEADEVENVLDVIVMQLAVTEPYEAAVVLLDEMSLQRRVARTLITPVEDFHLPDELFDTHQPVWISDVAQATTLPEAARTSLLAQGFQTTGTIPLRARARELPLAWLVVAYTEPREFAPEDERYLTTLADSAATTLDNRYLFLRTESALQEASILYQASRALFEGSGPQDVLEAVVNHLLHEHAAHVFIALVNQPSWDAPGVSATVAANWSAGEVGVDLQGVALNADQFPAWRLLATPQLLTIDDVQADSSLSELEKMGIGSLGAQSVVVMPLRAASRAIGAVWIGSSQPRRYSEQETRIYQAFAEQASISLEAVHLFEQAERRAGQLQTSAQVSQFASSILDLDILLPRLVDLIKSAFKYDHVQIFLMDREDRFAVLRASTGEAGKQLLAIGHKLEKGSASVIGAVTAQAQPVVALDTGLANTIHRPNPYLPHTRSEMALPLVIKGKVVGAFDVQSNHANAFTDEDVAVLTTLAAQISVAIDNARLFEQAERRASDMSLLFAVTTAAASAESLADALGNVAGDLRDSLNALSIGIYLPVEYLDEISGEVMVTMRAAAVAGYDAPLSTIAEIRVGDPSSAIGIASETFRSRIINRIEAESLYTPLAADAQSAVIVPLTSAGQIVGLITMENAQPFAYNHETLTLLQTMGGTLTALIQNQQLLERLQQTNEQLLEIDRLKSEFLANMSHELRTPLNSIIGFSRVILKGIDGPLTEMQEQDLTTIYNSGQHLLNLINDILDQAKIAAGKMEIKPDYFDIKPVVEAVRSIGIGLVKDKPVEIKVDIESGLPNVYGDEFRTRQVLLNLLSNAAKFTQQGSITVRVYRSQHSDTGQPVVRVDVTDTGIGIAEKDVPLLFEAFRQIDSSLTRVAGGTGLGLPISKSLIELQGGEMFVRSQLNEGSTFSITVPLDPPSTKRKGDTDKLPRIVVAASDDEDTVNLEEQSANGATNGKKQQPESESRRTSILPAMLPAKRQVLIIEDNPDRVDQFRRMIQREGFDVFAASIPLEAEAMASGLRPSVIVMDVDFAGGAGWDILQKIKERDDTFDIPVIVVTLSNQEARAREAGAFAFLQHPIVPDDLIAAVLQAEQESNTERILIIDDQPDSARLLKQLLDEHGRYRVFAAHNGSEGVSMVARRRPDLVILDLRMPEMDGFDVLQELRSNPETSNIPVLIVTGDTLNADEQNQLAGVEVMFKTDISLEDYQRFIQDVQTHLSRNGE